MALENYFDIPNCVLSLDIVQCAKAHDQQSKLQSKLRSNLHYVILISLLLILASDPFL